LQGEVELRSGGCKLKPSLIWIKAVGIEDGNCEKVTTRMQPTVIVWDLETVPDLGGFAAAHDLVGKSDVEVREAIGEKFQTYLSFDHLHRSPRRAPRARPLGGGRPWRATRGREDRKGTDHRVLR
jgi:hypothetical protein